MVGDCLNVRPDSKAGQFLGNKLVSVIVGFLQFVLYITALMQMMFAPTSVQTDPSTGSVVGGIILLIIFIGFCALLLVGLFKDNEGYINMYLIANVVLTVIFIIGFLTALFTAPAQYGVSGFIYMIIAILQNLLFFFVIRNYSSALSSKRKQPIRGPV